jgi:hypothetical protein
LAGRLTYSGAQKVETELVGWQTDQSPTAKIAQFGAPRNARKIGLPYAMTFASLMTKIIL